MLDINELLAVRTIVTHAECADGIASALILRDALPGARVVFVQHNTPEHRDLAVEPGMLFCDMVPVRERAHAFAGAGTIVLDHHRGAADVVALFGKRGVFADESAEPGVSGAMLAYREVWEPMTNNPNERDSTRAAVSAFAVLAGIRDTWQRNDPRWREACAQAAALRFWPADLLLAGGLDLIEQRLAIGEVLLDRDEERDTKSLAEAHRFEVDGLRVVCFDGLHTSDIADRADADLVLGWHYQTEGQKQKMVVSCRSRNGFSCLDFAKANGGGGHMRAAGFAMACPPENPYRALRDVLCAYMTQRQRSAA
jgi:hypothetical protein